MQIYSNLIFYMKAARARSDNKFMMLIRVYDYHLKRSKNGDDELFYFACTYAELSGLYAPSYA